MEEQVGSALVIMVVGMLTVFSILVLVILSAYLLINVLNKTGFILNKSQSDGSESNDDHTKAIRQAISKWSSGKAVVKNIKQIS